MPIKLAISGPILAGKKSVAIKLAEEYNLEVFKPEDLMNEMEKIMNPPEEEEDPKKKKGDVPEVNEEEVKQIKEVGELAEKWREQNSESMALPEEFTVRLLVIKIKDKFVKKSSEELDEILKERITKENEI